MSEGARNLAPIASLAPHENQDAGAQVRFLRLPVAEIRPYERNPRRADNLEYDRIMVSIRAEGMDQPLVVTQRPGDERIDTVRAQLAACLAGQAIEIAQTGDAPKALHRLTRRWNPPSRCRLRIPECGRGPKKRRYPFQPTATTIEREVTWRTWKTSTTTTKRAARAARANRAETPSRASRRGRHMTRLNQRTQRRPHPAQRPSGRSRPRTPYRRISNPCVPGPGPWRPAWPSATASAS